MHDLLPFSWPGVPSPKPEVKESKWRSVMCDLGCSGSLVHHGTYSWALASRERMVPSATRPTNIIASGHLEVLAVSTFVRMLKLPCT